MRSDPQGFLITGGTGFIGQALSAGLRAEFGETARIVALGSECDLRTPAGFDALRRLGETFAFDHIFHLAARAPSGAWLARHPAEAWYDNTLINASVFEAAGRCFPNAKVTTTLSYSIYPASEAAQTEESIGFSRPEDNLAAYSNSKIAVLAAQDAYRSQYGLTSCSVVLPTVYGPSPKGLNPGQVVPSLCVRFLNARRDGADAVELWGNGHQERDFLFVDDAVRGLIASARSQTSPLLNLGSGLPTSIRKLAATLAGLVGFSGQIRYDDTGYTGPERRWMACDKARDEIGWAPLIPLEEGLARTLSFVEGLQDAGHASLQAPVTTTGDTTGKNRP